MDLSWLASWLRQEEISEHERTSVAMSFTCAERTTNSILHVCPEGLSRVEVAVESDDEDPAKLSRLAGLYLGLADVKDAFRYSSFFALPEVEGQEVGAPWIGRVCPCFSSLPMGHTWSLFFCQKAIEEAMWTTPGLEKAKILQDTRSCVIPRPSDEKK